MNRNKLTRLAAILLAFVLAMLLAALAISCGKEKTDDKIGVVVTILPQAEFVEKVGGDKVSVTVMVPSGADPHTFEVTSEQMKAVSNSQMYAKVGSGVEFELTQANDLFDLNKDMLIIDCSDGITLIEMTAEHDHGDGEEEHEEGNLDPHIWMSPENAKTMVQNICGGLVQIDPENEVYYEEHRDAYLQELTQLDQDIRDGLSEVDNRKFLVYHPSFGYFAAEYDITIIAVEEEGKEETGKSIQHVIDQAKEYNIKVIFASPQFSQASAETIAEGIGGKVISIDPLARDYVTNMHTLLDELEQVTGSGKNKEVSALLSYIMFSIGVVAILVMGGVMAHHLILRRKI